MIVTAARALLVGAIAWGAFSFGAVYSWGDRPLAAAAALVGLAGLVTLPRLPRGTFPASLAAAFIAIAIACTLQIYPLPAGFVARVSPEASTIQNQYRLGAGGAEALPLSISSSDTARALAIFAALAVLTIGGASLLTLAGTTRLSAGIAVTGVLLAITGIVQKALGATQPLGFWTTIEGGNPYGPFVNRNHFAGWMLMAVPLCLGLLCAMISRQMRGIGATVRERMLWFGTPAASRAVLLGAGITTMVLSVFLTQSRGGIMGAVFGIVASAVLIWQRYSRSSRIAIVGLLATLLVGVAVWAGLDQVLQRLGEAATHDYTGRTVAWANAWDLWRRYPLTGTGINTFNMAMLFYQQFQGEVHLNAAHNDYLQILAEGGVLVGVPVLAAIAALALTIGRRFRQEASQSTFWIRAGATIGLLSIAIQEIGDFSLQIPGNAFFFAVLCAIAIHRTPERRRA